MADVSKSRFDRPVVYVSTVLLLLAVGGGVCAYLIATREDQQGEPPKDPGPLVRVCRVRMASHRLAVTAYGTTRASQQWTAIAEVRGRATVVNPRFEAGELLEAAEPLVTIDPTDYELAVKRLEAETLAKELALKELEQTRKNLNKIIEPQTHQRKLAEAEYERLKNALDREAVSISAMEAAANAYETSLTALLRTQNELALLDVRRELMLASLAAVKTQLEQARRDLARCEIVLPFDARCASKSIEVNQYVAVGEPLGTFLALDTAEVVAMFETRKMPLIFPENVRDKEVLDLADLTRDDSFFKQLHIPVEVSWALGDRRPTWWGRVTRIGSALDPGTQTVAVIVEIPDPYKNVKPGVRPPLIPDVFCTVTAYGATLDSVIVIPRDALRDGRVYVLRESESQDAAGQRQDEDSVGGIAGTLHKAPVEVLALEENLAVIATDRKTVQDGDLIVLADLFPAAEGMLLQGKLVENPVKPRGRIDIDPKPEATP